MTVLTLYGITPSKTVEIDILDLDSIDWTHRYHVAESINEQLTLKPEVNTFFRVEADDSDKKWDLAIRFTEEFLSTAIESDVAVQYYNIAYAFILLGHKIKEGALAL